MQPLSISLLTVCGLEELDHHGARAVTHVLSILDPDWPDPEAFLAYDPHHRTILRFHDAIEPGPGVMLPEVGHVEAVLAFGRALAHGAEARGEGAVFRRLQEIRPQAWPNSRMIGFADELLGRNGRMVAATSRLYARQLAARPHLADTMRGLGRAREVAMAGEAKSAA